METEEDMQKREEIQFFIQKFKEVDLDKDDVKGFLESVRDSAERRSR